MTRNQPPDPERIQQVLTLALGLGALAILALGVYLLVSGQQPVAGAALIAAGAVEGILAQFLPRIIARRAAEARRQRPGRS